MPAHARPRPRLARARRPARRRRGRSRATPTIVAAARRVLLDGARRIAAEVRNSLDFHLAQGGNAVVERAVLAGPAARHPRLRRRALLGARPAGHHRRRRRRARRGSTPAASPLPPVSPSRRCRHEGRQPDPADESARGSGRSRRRRRTPLLGVLALLVAMSAMYTLAGRSVDTKRGDLAAVTARAQTHRVQGDAATSATRCSRSCASRASRPSRSSPRAASTGPARCTRSPARCPPAAGSARSARRSTPSAQVAGTADPLRARDPVAGDRARRAAPRPSRASRGVVAALRGIARRPARVRSRAR